jgi:seryl-tRNA synthetase
MRLMILHIASLLRELHLGFRIIPLEEWDMSFSAAYSVDFEIFLPVSKWFLEISSVSNCCDYQTRRYGRRFNRNKDKLWLHSLNGSSLPIGRLLTALVEYHMNKNGEWSDWASSFIAKWSIS